MTSYLIRRLPTAIGVLFGASLVVFLGSRLIPGDPAYVLGGPDATPAVLKAIRHDLGLNQSLPVQYLKWLHGLLTANLGRSYIQGAPIGSLIARSGANTLQLAFAAMIVAVMLGFGVGILGAVSQSRVGQTVGMAYSTLAFSIPTYVAGVLFLLVFAVQLRWLPIGGNPTPVWRDPRVALEHIAMPAVCLGLPASAVIARYLMTSLRQTMQEDYIRMAVAKGLSRPRVIVRHGLRNALPPVLTVVGLEIGGLLGGAVIVEQIFSWPGVGRLALQAAIGNDFLIIEDLAVIAVAIYMLVQLLTDIAYMALDPRIVFDE